MIYDEPKIHLTHEFRGMGMLWFSHPKMRKRTKTLIHIGTLVSWVSTMPMSVTLAQIVPCPGNLSAWISFLCVGLGVILLGLVGRPSVSFAWDLSPEMTRLPSVLLILHRWFARFILFLHLLGDIPPNTFHKSRYRTRHQGTRRRLAVILCSYVGHLF